MCLHSLPVLTCRNGFKLLKFNVYWLKYNNPTNDYKRIKLDNVITTCTILSFNLNSTMIIMLIVKFETCGYCTTSRKMQNFIWFFLFLAKFCCIKVIVSVMYFSVLQDLLKINKDLYGKLTKISKRKTNVLNRKLKVWLKNLQNSV